MIERFNHWYRYSVLKNDGRVIWWEHADVWVLLTTVIGFPLGRWVFYSHWPLTVAVLVGLLLGTWSWWQDVLLNRDRTEPVAEEDMEVPVAIQVYALLFPFALVLAWWSLLRL